MDEIAINSQLVVLVFIITFSTWFVFLDVCSRLNKEVTNLTRSFWLIAPVLLGFPVWAIYFIARLSINVPILINQHWLQMLLTVCFAVLMCFFACLAVVIFSRRIFFQVIFSVAITLLFSLMHMSILYLENNVSWFKISDDLYVVLLLGSLITFVLLRVASLLKDSSYVKHIVSGVIVTSLTAVMYLLELPRKFLVYSGEGEFHDYPLFDNLSFGYAVGLTAVTLLIMLMVGVWFSRAHTLTSKPTKTLRIGILIIALGMVAIVSTTRWLIEHTLSQDIIVMYELDTVEHETEAILKDVVETHNNGGNILDILSEKERFEPIKLNVGLLVTGGRNEDGEMLSPLRNTHMVYDLETLIYLIDSLIIFDKQAVIHYENAIERLTALEGIILDVQSDVHIAINNDRNMLSWSNYAISFILVMMFVAFSWLISRGWYAIEAKNKQLERLVEKRTREMRKVMQDLDRQMSDLAANNAKISLLNEALAELRDHDHLYDEGEYKEFYGIMLLNVIRVVNAAFAFYVAYDERRDIQEKYLYGDSALKEEILTSIIANPQNKLTKILLEEEVSIKIDDVHIDRITEECIEANCHLKCFLGVPVLVEQKVVGIIGFFNKEDGTCFSDDDEILVNIFSSHLAHVLERHGFLKSKVLKTSLHSNQTSDLSGLL